MNLGYILVVDDEPEIRRLVQEILEDEHYKVAVADGAEPARALYQKQRPDLVLLDIWMPGTDGISLLKEWSSGGRPEVPVIMMSGHGTVETAVEATRLGAYDFIEKPLSMGKLLVTVERALAAERMRRENVRLKRAAEPDTFLIGKSALMQRLREDVERIALSESWVLIVGEPGTGRAGAARYVHYHSARSDRPLVEVSLGAVPPPNVAVKLFGAEQGEAITPGSFEQADDGTLVLNDVVELAAATQLQLLHAFQERRFMRVGGREPVPLDARIIAISDLSLPDAVAEGRFREDLYYRLNVVPLRLPPLRDHREDVPELLNLYVDWLVDNERLAYRRFTTGAVNALRHHPWPGNIRELKNVVQRLLILNRGDEITEAEVEQALGGRPRAVDSAPQTLFNLPLREARDLFEKAYLEHHLGRTGGNVAEVARLSEMERTHLYRKLKNLGINPKAVKEP
ncbi:nitrogen assimilation regulatory protein NtrX [Sulfurifustis variabilis]|uniref:Nitrogen assimilation regulatory protein NtrX n=1 Tax=Sulfurifustis variabilis TaxID=1675686 RepID=A0A1B4UZN2_9GAMM|nr:sigma-54 dependent transcriptional regulator [Sulfurifustis variabilis]BAU46599.1 nitrogen assimilation regulatory protein NtrX [Sulfurifustis variabilis]